MLKIYMHRKEEEGGKHKSDLGHFGQGFLLHDQRNFGFPDCYEMNYAQELLFKEQGGHIFLSKRHFMQW
jgi:hypothetical protein